MKIILCLALLCDIVANELGGLQVQGDKRWVLRIFVYEASRNFLDSKICE